MKVGFREMLFVVLMLGLLGASYYFVFKPGAEKRTARSVEMVNKKKALTDLRSATAGIGDLERKIDELQKAITFFESKLPQEKEIDKILTDVTKKAEEHQLTMKSFKTMKIERAAGYSELPIQMSMSGDFKGFYAYLLDLEKLQRITRLTQMKLEKDAKRDGEMHATMTLSIFFEQDSGGKVAGAH